MEIKGATLLYTLAGLMITFAGFSALLLTLRPATGAKVSLLDRYLARTVMTFIFVLTAAALLPTLLALYDIQETWIWRGSGVLFALPMLFLQLTYSHRRRKVVGKGPPPAIFAVLVVLGATADRGDAGVRCERGPVHRRRLHHGVDGRLLYRHFRLRDRSRCHHATAHGRIGAACVSLADVRRGRRCRRVSRFRSGSRWCRSSAAGRQSGRRSPADTCLPIS